MTKITVDKALLNQAIEAAFSPYCAQDLGILVPALRAALAEPTVEPDDQLHCDICGDVTDDPWHFSTSQDRHKHACDKCWESKKALRAALAPVAVEPVWNGKLSDAMQKALNALHLECPPEVVSEIAFRVRQECEAIYTSYITVKRMYHAARDELEARDTKAEELKSALAEPAVEQPDDSDINQVHEGNAETSYESMVFGVTTPVREPAPVQEPCAELVEYILQDDRHNRLTPRVVDIAYSAFMIAKQGKNKDDGGPCDWFNDTKPMVMEQLAKIKKDMAEEAAPLRKPSPPAEVPQLTPGEVALMWVSESFDTMSYESCYTRGVKRGEQVVRKNAGLR